MFCSEKHKKGGGVLNPDRTTPGGGHWPRGMGMCCGHDPLFSGHPALLSLPIYHHCAALMPPFSNFRKNFHFQPCFGQNFSCQDTNFCSLDPSFIKENPLPRPYFWKPVWHTPTKKKWSAPPPDHTLHKLPKLGFKRIFSMLAHKVKGDTELGMVDSRFIDSRRHNATFEVTDCFYLVKVLYFCFIQSLAWCKCFWLSTLLYLHIFNVNGTLLLMACLQIWTKLHPIPRRDMKS